MFVICILPGTKSRMTSPGYKKGKRFRWIILRAALWVEISKQARVEGGKFQGWILRARTHTAHARTDTHAHSARKLPSEKAPFFSLRSLFKIYPKSFDFVSFQPLPTLPSHHLPSLPPSSLPPPAGPRRPAPHGLGHACEHVQHRQYPGGQTSLQGLGAAAPERRARRLPQPPRGLALRQRLRLRRILLPGGGSRLRAAAGRHWISARLQQLLLRAAACAGVPRGPFVLRGRAAPGHPAVLLRSPRR